MIRQAWLIGAALALGTAAGGCGDDSGGAESDDSAATRRLVAAALTAGIDFEQGTVRLAVLPETTNDDLVIEQDDEAVSLEPGTVSLLSFSVDNPDEEEDAVAAVLLQFEDDEDQHIEVTLEMLDAASSFEVPFTVDSNICNNLCNAKFDLRLLQKLKLQSGAIGRIARRTFSLDCTARGFEDLCESADDKPDAGGDGDGDTAGDGDGDTTSGSTTLAGQFNNNVTMLNRLLCTCAGTPGTHCDTDWLNAEEQSCAFEAITADAASTNVSRLSGGLATLVDGAMICDPTTVFALALPDEAFREMPASLVRCAPDSLVVASAATEAGRQ